MTGWAATNTLRDVVALAYRRAAASPDACREADAALALVETALDAADEIGAYAGSGDMREPGPYVLVRVDEIDALAAALRAVREGA